MADISQVIADSVSDAESGMADSVADTSAPEVVAEPAVTAEPAARPAASVAASPAADSDPVDAALAELGIKAPVEGERENRIPYSRVRKITANAIKKEADRLLAEHTKTLKEREDKLTVAEKRAKDADNWDNIVATDDVRLLQALAAIHPQRYSKYLQTSQPPPAKEPAKKVAASVIGPKPEPDYRFEDGTMGYTPEGWAKLGDWQLATAEAKAEAKAQAAIKTVREDMEKQYRPLLEERQAREAAAKAAPVVDAQLARAEARYGDLFLEDRKLGTESEVIKWMGAHRTTVHPSALFETACQEVLLPKMLARLTADKGKVREEVIAELNRRPAAASSAAAAPAKAGVEKSGPRSIEDVIRDAVAGMA